MSRNKKFKDIWESQTDIGKRFGISAIKVGKILVEYGLKDPKTKEATEKALSEGYAKSTPLKDGTPHYMWNFKKVQEVISEKHTPISLVDYWVNEVKAILQKADKLTDEGQDKFAYLIYDSVYDEVPKRIREEVKFIVEKQRQEE